MNHKSIILAFAIFCLLFSTGQAKVYYVTSKGDDSQSGTSVQEAWKSIEKASSFVFNGGDSLLLQGGDIFSGSLAVKRTLSNSEQMVYIGSFGKGKATIQAGQGNGVFIHNSGGVVIDNLNIKGSGHSTNEGRGVYCLNDRSGKQRFSNITIQNTHVSGFRWAGIYVGGVPTDLQHGITAPDGNRFGFENVTIAYCKAFDNGYYGIHLSAAYSPEMNDYGNYNVTITRCEAYNNSGDPTYFNNHSGSGIMVDDTRKASITYCKAWNNGFLCPCNNGGPAGIWSHASDSVTIAYCESFSNKTNSTKDGAGFDFDAGMTNSVIEYCFSHHNDGAGYLNYAYAGAPKKWDNNVIRHSISLNDGLKNDYAALFIGTDGVNQTNSRFYNNTLINTKASDQFKGGIICYNNTTDGINSNIQIADNFIVTNADFPIMIIANTDTSTRIWGNVFLNLENLASFKINGKDLLTFSQWEEANDYNDHEPDFLLQCTNKMLTEIHTLIDQESIYYEELITGLHHFIRSITKRENLGAGSFSLRI